MENLIQFFSFKRNNIKYIFKIIQKKIKIRLKNYNKLNKAIKKKITKQSMIKSGRN